MNEDTAKNWIAKAESDLKIGKDDDVRKDIIRGEQDMSFILISFFLHLLFL